jgi:cytoskeletal protein CcmA (bactofilin family)
MSLFNSKDPEKNHKLHPVSTPQVQPASIAPAADSKSNTNGTARPGAMAPTDGRAYLDRGSRISGKLFFEAPAQIDGHVEGEIIAKDSLTIGETAVIAAQIRAASVIVAGKVSGDIIAGQRIEIRPSAKVLGNITSPALVIHEGAVFEGHCAMQQETNDDRKITVFPKEERLAQAAGQKPA